MILKVNLGSAFMIGRFSVKRTVFASTFFTSAMNSYRTLSGVTVRGCIMML